MLSIPLIQLAGDNNEKIFLLALLANLPSWKGDVRRCSGRVKPKLRSKANSAKQYSNSAIAARLLSSNIVTRVFALPRSVV